MSSATASVPGKVTRVSLFAFLSTIGKILSQPKSSYEPVKIVRMKSQAPGGFAYVALGLIDGFQNQAFLGLPHSVVESAFFAALRYRRIQECLRQILRHDGRSRTQDHGVFDGVSQFANIAGPIIFHQHGPRLLRNSSHL